MAYDKNNKMSVSFFRRAVAKFGKLLAKSFPLNSIRKLGIKLCGFKLGEKVYIGEGLIVASTISNRSCNLLIGDRVAIGPRVTIILSSDANWSRLMDFIVPIRSTVILEEDCWIGAGAIIMPGITVGKGSIVGAGSIVTKSIPPFSVVVGNPARIIKTLNSF